MGWLVGNGQRIRLWHDLWISLQHPQLLIGPSPLNSENLLVHDLLCPSTMNGILRKIRLHLAQYEGLIRQLVTSSALLDDSLVWLMKKK